MQRLSTLKQLILEKTEGTPFFMEEIVQELVEQGVLGANRCRGGTRTLRQPALASSPDRPRHPRCTH